MIRAFLVTIFMCAMPAIAGAQGVHQDLQEILTVEVAAIIDSGERVVPGTETVVPFQTVRADIVSGNRAGETITFDNELASLAVGDRAYVNYLKTINGDEFYLFKDFVRTAQVGWLVASFVALLLLFARWQGVRALISLALSIGAIFWLLIPALLAGYDPALVSLGIAGIVLAVVLFITHGLKAVSLIAFGGTFAAVALTCATAWFWVEILRLSGFGNETAVYLNFSTDGQLDFAGLLLGGIIIGILGVLDDVSITQAAIVAELKAANKQLRLRELYTRALRVGRSHVGSLVNTLVFAYVGVSLPLILLFARAESDLILSLNQEIVVAELVRIIVGSMGLILAVPLTTLLAAWWFDSRSVEQDALVENPCGHHHH